MSYTRTSVSDNHSPDRVVKRGRKASSFLSEKFLSIMVLIDSAGVIMASVLTINN